MARITVVIDGATDPVSLGTEVLGGKVVSAAEGDSMTSRHELERLCYLTEQLASQVLNVIKRLKLVEAKQ